MTTKIQWTERTWNPIAGCSVVSPGCTNCYAMRRVAPRLAANPATPQYHGTVKPSKGGHVWTGKIGVSGSDKFLEPLGISKPSMWFVNSTSDLFHEGVPDGVTDRVFAVMALCPQHTFQLLTKRSKRMLAYVSRTDEAWHGNSDLFADRFNAAMDWNHARFKDIDDMQWPLPNVWLGVSVEDQTRADERIPDLLDTPAAIRFISAEPLLGPVDLTWIAEPDDEKDGVIDALLGCNWIDGMGRGIVYRPTRAGHAGRVMTRHVCSSSDEILANRKIDWVIVGGESGSGARPMHPDWGRAIRDQCAAAGVPFFFKQWGNWLPWEPEHGPCWKAQNGRSEDRHALFPDEMEQDPKWDDGLWAIPEELEHFVFQNVGTNAAGRFLDSIEHYAMPERS